MNKQDLQHIISEHKAWLMTIGNRSYRGHIADLRGEDLRDAELNHVRLSYADLSHADLRGAKMFLSSLRKANLRGANFRGADLRSSCLIEADLTYVDLRKADLRGADLRDAKLCKADLRGANLGKADLRGADLSGADLPDRTYVIHGEEYEVIITNGEYVRIGDWIYCVNAWRNFSRIEVAGKDGGRVMKFYPRLLDILDFYLGKGSRPAWVNELEADA